MFQRRNNLGNGDKNCQAGKSDMQPKKPAKDMQSNGPAMLIQHKKSKKQMPQEDDKNCQSTNYYGATYADKECQADKNCQRSYMHSMTKNTDV